MKDKIVFIKTNKGNFFRYQGRFYVVNEKSILAFKSRLSLPFTAKFIGFYGSEAEKIIYGLLDKEMKVSIKKLNSDSLHYVAYFSNVKKRQKNK